ncbi:hypothetical protein SUGI_1070920 [Cryptomeria japonica]|nr:hypothetical protein SUGI_0939710 [Cryptomeria japonica]GLJ50286.1 hypothetical protein SUGI_1070920 [Cryptomeria japonica]
MVRQPKWGHIKDLHRAIKLCEPATISSDPEYRYLGPGLEAHLYYTDSGTCSAFIANTDQTKDLATTFNGNTYSLSAWSMSILPDCKNVVFNTTKDTTDYLWYTTSLQVEEKEPFSSSGLLPVLIVESRGHAMHLFINNEFIGSGPTCKPWS